MGLVPLRNRSPTDHRSATPRIPLRVYWRPLEDWADILYQWALKTGKLRLDVKSIVIQEVDEDFASLPEKDIHIVLALMVKKELAEWIDAKRGAILIFT